MTRSVVRISKAVVKAWAVSFVTLLAVALLALFIVETIPSTPFAVIHHIQDISNNNPAVYDSGLFQEQAPIADFWDGVVITGISFLIAGIPFGWITGRKGQRLISVLLNAAACAFVLSALIVGIGWIGVTALSRDSYLEAGLTPLNLMPNARYWETGSLQVALWTAAFLSGAFLATRLPRRAVRSAPKQAPVA